MEILLIVLGGIILFFIIIPRIKNKIRNEQYEQQIHIQQQQHEQMILKQKEEEDKRIQENIDWLNNVEATKNVYTNTKKYITKKDWLAFIEYFKFLKITKLYNIITKDDILMKPYLKCSVYEFSNGLRMILRLKKTGLENEAIIFYNENLFDNEDLNQIKLFFEENKLGKNTHKVGRAIPLKLRDEIFRRDGYKCVHCGRRAEDGIKLNVDHIIPFSKGGTSHKNNLQTLCNECNLGKSNRHNN